ncbi:MAG: type II toxin-antitoxin system HicA family toxin [Methanolinea sp.]
MSGLPVVKGKDLLKVLSRLGYQVVRQRGSHVRLKCPTPTGEHAITIPLHDEIAPGTLNDILSKVSLWKSIPKEDLIRMFQ